MNSAGLTSSGVALLNATSLHLNLTGPSTITENHLMSEENLCTLTFNEAVAQINHLMTENAQLKLTIQQTNSSMKMACESFAELKRKSKKDEEEHLLHYNQSKTVVTDLRKKIADKDRIIENLKKQIHQDDALLGPSDQLKHLQTEIEGLMHENQHLKAILAKQEIPAEDARVLKLQLANLLTSQETAKQQFFQEKTVLQQRSLSLEKQMHMRKVEEQKRLEHLQLENEKMSTELQQVTLNYEQLMSDYHDLLTSSDQQRSTQDCQVLKLKKDFENRLDNLTAQLVTAEEVLLRKEDQIQTLQQKLSDLEPLQAQVAIYKADFEAERKSREELNDRCLELTEKCKLLERELQKFARLPEVVPGPNMTNNAQLLPVHDPPFPVVGPMPEPEQFKCPVCGEIAPDLDSIQLHVNECIERQ